MPVPSLWTEWAAAGSLLTVIFFVVLALVKNGLRPVFASREEMGTLTTRVVALEASLASLATKDDLHGVERRLSNLDHAVSGLEARSGRLEEGIKAVRHMTQVLLDHQLQREGHEPR